MRSCAALLRLGALLATPARPIIRMASDRRKRAILRDNSPGFRG
jgi:hypothetical protein